MRVGSTLGNQMTLIETIFLVDQRLMFFFLMRGRGVWMGVVGANEIDNQKDVFFFYSKNRSYI